MVSNYFKIAWRNIVRHKAFTFINSLGLALGICICLVIYGIASFEYSFDTFHPDRGRIYRLVGEASGNNGDKYGSDQIPNPIPVAAGVLLPGLQEMAPYIPYPAKVSVGGGEAGRVFDNKLKNASGVSTILTGTGWFNIFKYDWVAGNAARALSRPFQLVITESTARLYFGSLSPDKIIGQQVVFNDSLRVTVAGIVKDWNHNTDFPYTEFISIGTVDNSFLKKDFNLTDWGYAGGGHNTRGLVKLSPGQSPEAVDRQLAALVVRNMKIASGTSFRVRLQPLADVHFNAAIYNDRRKAHLPTLYGLEAIAVFILLIAAINFINLSTAMSIRRAKEIGIRKVLGSKRADLVFQFLAETLILTFFSLCVAMLLVQPVLGAFHSFLPDGLRFHFGSPATVSFVLVLLVVTALLAGLYPARVLSSYEPVVVLKGGDGQKGGGKGYFRKGLIVFQFVVSLVFIIGVLVVRDQINYIRNKDLGFESHAVISIDTDWEDSITKVSLFAEEIRHLPGVDRVALQSFPPLTAIYTGLTIEYKGKKTVDLPGSFSVPIKILFPCIR
jgi:putative ABC transport system permease protein